MQAGGCSRHRRCGARCGRAGGVPVTVKMRMGIDDRLLTFLDAGRIAEDEGAAAVALHARTAAQRYAGAADWDAIAELKAAVTTVPVLGNGDIWEAADALRDDGARPGATASSSAAAASGGRGCSASWRPRSPGRRPPTRRRLSARSWRSCAPRRAARRVSTASDRGCGRLPQARGWYLTGYPVGGERPAPARPWSDPRRAGRSSSTSSTARWSTSRAPRPLPRGHTDGPRPVALPEGWLDDVDDPTPPVGAELLVSGG